MCFCYELSCENTFFVVTKFRVETYSKEEVVLNLREVTNIGG